MMHYLKKTAKTLKYLMADLDLMADVVQIMIVVILIILIF